MRSGANRVDALATSALGGTKTRRLAPRSIGGAGSDDVVVAVLRQPHVPARARLPDVQLRVALRGPSARTRTYVAKPVSL